MIQRHRTLTPAYWPAIFLFFFCASGWAQSQTGADNAGGTPRNPQASQGAISGRVVDLTGNFLVAAVVALAPEGHAKLEAKSNEQGLFLFPEVPAGTFELTISAPGFATRQVTGMLHPGETLNLLDVELSIAAATTEVQVSGGADHYELARQQVKVEETQRVLGVIPNFFVTYDPNAVSLNTKQKFELAWKTNIDPVTFAATGLIAGVEQASNGFSGYGQGTQGYAKRFGASYADGFIGNMIGGAILPSLLKQDPRYFYKGTGSTRSRIFYALASAVICKGDNGHWQPDYSGILGSLAAGGISNLYYPSSNRNGAELTFVNTLIGIGGSGIGNLFQEFLIRKLTPHARNPQPQNP
ncbi:MAG TPA: carboxypeptidase-like regulatory domain-containing protein [Acidobacteriaceae bacterium]|nr:carboxypeptidase-like regulatory domain-containing protein [Acidobacteriaceae bacterium]